MITYGLLGFSKVDLMMAISDLIGPWEKVLLSVVRTILTATQFVPEFNNELLKDYH